MALKIRSLGTVRDMDLIVNPEVKEVFFKRSAIIREIRNFLDEKDFELKRQAFKQYQAGRRQGTISCLDIDMYCRIALELPLKRLIVGGFEGL